MLVRVCQAGQIDAVNVSLGNGIDWDHLAFNDYGVGRRTTVPYATEPVTSRVQAAIDTKTSNVLRRPKVIVDLAAHTEKVRITLDRGIPSAHVNS